MLCVVLWAAMRLLVGTAIAETTDAIVCDGLATTWLSAEPGAPAAIFVPGQGPINKNGNTPNLIHSTPLFLADDLIHAGMNSLIFDKRGVGGSAEARGKPWNTSSMREEANDIQCLVRWVLENKKPSRVTLIGSNDGDFVAALAAMPGVDAIIMLPTFEGSISDWTEDLRQSGLGELAAAEIERTASAEMKGEPVQLSYSILRRPLDVLLRRVGAMRPPYNRLDIVSRLNVPILLVGAGWDFESSPSSFKRIAKSNPHVTTIFVPEMNNLLRPYTIECPDSCQRSRKPLGSPIEPKVVASIITFVACGAATPDSKNCQDHPLSGAAERAR